MSDRMTAQQLKNSILQLAVQGKLVSQDPNDEPASVLLERIRKEKEELVKEGKIKKSKNESYIYRGSDNLHYEKVGNKEPICIEDELPFEIPDNWEWVRLRTIVYNHGQMKPTENFSYIDIGSIDNIHQKLNEKETIIKPCNAPSRARKIVEYGDIIYSSVRPYLHNVCIIDKSFSAIPIASTGFSVLSCHTGICNIFLMHYLVSPIFDEYANSSENSKGVAYPAINDSKFYNALIAVPPLDEQKRIVDKLQNLKSLIDEYKIIEEQLYDLNSTIKENLKKSILQYAIEGKLVPQDPSDEPASILLEKINKEKQKLIQEAKIKKTSMKLLFIEGIIPIMRRKMMLNNA